MEEINNIQTPVKKFYNPFKLWGSYVTAIVFFILGPAVLAIPILNYLFIIPMLLIDSVIIEGMMSCSGSDCLSYAMVSMRIMAVLYGFVIGWVIHSLARNKKLKK
ncbi:hypothetical protein ACFLZC_02900 [Patescibacteria group bacterium]